jgi:hypothetical protein
VEHAATPVAEESTELEALINDLVGQAGLALLHRAGEATLVPLDPAVSAKPLSDNQVNKRC